MGSGNTIEAVEVEDRSCERERSSSLAPIEITLFGVPKVTMADRVISDGLVGKPELLFVYLALHRDEWSSREDLEAKMWEDKLPWHPEHALSNLLSKIKLRLGDRVLHDRGRCFLELPEGSSVDTELVIELTGDAKLAFEAGRWDNARDAAQAALDKMTERLAIGHDALWLDGQQRRFGVHKDNALKYAARASLKLGDPDAARAAAEQLVERDPLSTEATQLLMAAELASDRPTAARAAYDDLMERYRVDNLQVSPETSALRKMISAPGMQSKPSAMRPSAELTAAPTIDPPMSQRSEQPRPIETPWRFLRRRRLVAATLAVLATLGVVVVVVMPHLLQGTANSSSRAQPNRTLSSSARAKSIARRSLAAFAAGERDQLRDLLAPEIIFIDRKRRNETTNYHGKDSVLKRLVKLRSYFKNIRYETRNLIEKDGSVEYDVEWSGRQTRPFPNGTLLAPDGQVKGLRGRIKAKIKDRMLTSIVFDRYYDTPLDDSG